MRAGDTGMAFNQPVCYGIIRAAGYAASCLHRSSGLSSIFGPAIPSLKPSLLPPSSYSLGNNPLKVKLITIFLVFNRKKHLSLGWDFLLNQMSLQGGDCGTSGSPSRKQRCDSPNGDAKRILKPTNP